jgi:nucleoside-diphosphate-sugar epimerase
MQEEKLVLVTGGSGFVGSYCIIALLNKGYQVRTTVRSLEKVSGLKAVLQNAGVDKVSAIQFVVADLTKDEGWSEAVKGCRYVLHVASPFPLVQPADENELIIPARDGALRVLKAARDAGVERVVLTSSFAAIGYSKSPKDHVFTELDWTEVSESTHPYIKSKTMAERAAWDFLAQEGNGLELSVINPVGIFGPALGKDVSSSIQMIAGIISGAIKESMPYYFGVVDVRDVAEIHVAAMLHPRAKGERFLATSEGTVCFKDIATLIKKERPEAAEKMADIAQTDPELYMHLSNEKARTMLGWQPRPKEEALLATVDSLRLQQ